MLHPPTTAIQNRPPSTFIGSVAIYALTEAGCKQAKTMHRLLPSTLFLSSRFASAKEYNIFEPRKIGELIAENWQNFDGHIFIMATGIVLRKIAPLLKGKTEDPAVITCDELGQYAISLLGGHISGANRLAEELAEKMGGQAVITTGTEAQAVIAFDELALRNNWDIVNPEAIKELNSLLLQRRPIGIALPPCIKAKSYAQRDHIILIEDSNILPDNIEGLVTLENEIETELPTLKFKRKPLPKKS